MITYYMDNTYTYDFCVCEGIRTNACESMSLGLCLLIAIDTKTETLLSRFCKHWTELPTRIFTIFMCPVSHNQKLTSKLTLSSSF